MKRKLLRNWKAWSLGAVPGCCVMLFVLAAGFSGCVSLRMSETEIRRAFEQRGLAQPRHVNHQTDEGILHLVISGDLNKPAVIFVHGSPGSWDNYLSFLADPSLLDEYCLVSVDRPGFGQTTPKSAEPYLQVQAERIHKAVSFAGVRPGAIWVGHSLGGPVVCLLAVEHPTAVSGLVLVAPSLDPELEKRRWYNWLGKFPPVRWGLSRPWENSNEEIFPLKRELLAMAERAPELTVPVIVIHGARDSLVPVENAMYVKRAFANAEVELRILEGVDHFIPWSHPAAIISAVRELSSE